MRFGVSIPNNFGVESPRDLAELAREAEGLGYDSVWVSEHLFHTAYVAERLGDRPYHEPLVTLTAAAMVTERVRLGTSVLVLPWHHPVRLAKALATIDALSGGRVTLGIGVAVTEDEYAALGVPFNQRGRIADEMLDAMRALWTQPVPAHHGERYRFEGLKFEPKPVQKPYPPIWVGGSSPAAVARTVRIGDGWHPLNISPAQLEPAVADLRTRLEAAGRETSVPVALRLQVDFRRESWDRPIEERKTARGTPDEILALVEAYARAGATDIIVDAATGDLDQIRDVFARFNSEVAPRISS